MPDPAEIDDARRREHAFKDTVTHLGRRIDLLLALSFESLERRALEERLRRIGAGSTETVADHAGWRGAPIPAAEGHAGEALPRAKRTALALRSARANRERTDTRCCASYLLWSQLSFRSLSMPGPTLQRRLTSLSAPRDRATELEVQWLVWNYVDDRKAAGWPVERIVIAMKRIADDAGVQPSMFVGLTTPTYSTSTNDLLAMMVGWCVERFYREE